MKGNKMLRMAGLCLLMVLFLAAAAFGIYSLQDQTGDKEKETKKDGVSVKKSERDIYEIGEDAKAGDIVCNVLEAEIIEDFNELDVSYREGKYLISPEEYSKSIYAGNNVFPEEIHFLHIKFSLKNNGDKKRSFSPVDLNFSSILDKDGVPLWPWKHFVAYDGEYMTESGEKSEEKFSGQKAGSDSTVSEDISLQPGETIVVNFVGEFQEYEDVESFYDYDLYLPIYDTGKKIAADPLGQKIHLKLERKYEGVKNTEEPVLYVQIRDIAAMKARSWTNSELSDGQEGYLHRGENQVKVLQHGEGGEEYSYKINQETINDVVVQQYIRVSQALDFQVTDWENMPEEFAGQGNLEQMAQRYQDIYGYKKEDLKVLFLDIAYSADGVGKKYEDGKPFQFYENSNLFMIGSDERWRVFGTADDWMVLSNSKNPENTGRISMERIAVGSTVTVRMAYILPPDFYQEKDALYYGGGESSLVGGNQAWTKIELK